jgi:ATP-dependent Lhr-like helicase
MGAGRSGLLHATTGAGKTLAVGLGAWQALDQRNAPPGESPALAVLWITPMRALAADTLRSLETALSGVEALLGDDGAPRWSTGLRTGDTTSAQRAAQARRQPSLLITTPESLCLMLSRPDAQQHFAGLGCVVVDEWHELLGNKRGVQTQLALARLRRWRPGLLVWGMSATLGNLCEAMRILLGPRAPCGALIEGKLDKRIVIDTLLPAAPERFPWAGYLGLNMLPKVIAEIERSANALVFTNTRSQAEIWYRDILAARPEWSGVIAVHHASIERDSREWVERGLKNGSLKAVVCTSSLDLGVDFLPVERVLQIGSPKGVARLLQRAGRSGHAPGRSSRITLVPSHSLELVESAAVQVAAAQGQVESQISPHAPLDALAQHLVTVALGGGFKPDDLLDEVRDTVAYETLDEESWRWCLDFVRYGGPTLRAYPDYRRCEPGADGVWRVPSKHLAMRHRLNIGTIASDAGLIVQYGPTPPGARLGVVEESFIARMRPGDRFWFAGRRLELVQVRDLVAYVRKGGGGRGTIPRWNGGRMPLSTTLADAMVEQLARAAEGRLDSPELRAAGPMLELQARWSALPTPDTLLAETLKTREGWHIFLYPFAGLLAWRAGQVSPGTFSMAVNDYGFELLSGSPRDWAAVLPGILDASATMEELRRQVLGSLNAGELTRRRFRDIARVAGLVPSAHPGVRKSARQLQASSSLFYDVFKKYDPDNALLRQAERELLEKELDIGPLRDTLDRMNRRTMVHKPLERCSPFAFPLLVEGFREKLSNESLTARIGRLVAQLERAADR